MPITGLGPRGEHAASPLLLRISDLESEEIARRRFSVAVVMHTTASDWARQQLAGMSSFLGQHQAAIVDLVDCGFDAGEQIAAFQRIAASRADAVVSIPIGNQDVARAHGLVHQSGKKLVLLDNAPTGLSPGNDYVSVVSADNFGLGEIAARLLAPHVSAGAHVGLLTYGMDFFATHEREIAFSRWMARSRPDIGVIQEKFASPAGAGSALERLLEARQLGGLFVVWDGPAMNAVDVLVQRGSGIPVTTVDLGNAAATNMARGGNIKGIAAQRPFDQGRAAGAALLLALLEREVPSWIALSGLGVTRDNVVQAYQTVWHAPAPGQLLSQFN